MSSENLLVEFLDENVVSGSCTKKNKNNGLDPRNLINKNRSNEIGQNLKLKHYRGKCAEIFIENDKCYIVCEFCEISFKTLEVFLCHIYKRHLIIKNPCHEMFSLQEEESVSNQIQKSEQQNNSTNIGVSKINNSNKSSAKYLIDVGYKNGDNQNLLEIIEDDNSIITNSNIATPDCFSPTKTFVINSDQNSKLICLPASNDSEIVFDEFLINPQQETNNIEQEFNLKSSFGSDECISYESSFCCDICNEVFSSTKDYKKHYEKHQNEWKNYICPICPKSFGSVFFQEKEFNSHMRKHLQQQGQKDLSCPNCNQSFVKQFDLLRHIEANHSNIFLIEKHTSNDLFEDALESI